MRQVRMPLVLRWCSRAHLLVIICLGFVILLCTHAQSVETDGTELPDLIVPKSSEVMECIQYTKDARFLATGGGRTINIWQMPEQRMLRTIQTRLPVRSLAFSPDGKLLAAGIVDEWDGNIKDTAVELYRIGDGKLLWSLSAVGVFVAFSPDGKVLATFAENKFDGYQRLAIRNVDDGKILKVITYWIGLQFHWTPIKE